MSDETESIRCRARRTISPDLNYDDALVHTGVVSLSMRRQTIWDKCVTKHLINFILSFPQTQTGYCLCNDNCLSIPKHGTIRFGKSFLARSKAYNSSFKSKLFSYVLTLFQLLLLLNN